VGLEAKADLFDCSDVLYICTSCAPALSHGPVPDDSRATKTGSPQMSEAEAEIPAFVFFRCSAVEEDVTITESQIQDAISAAITSFNDFQEAESQLDILSDAPLFGDGGFLDSIDLVNLIVEIENSVNDSFGVSVALADERAMSRRNSPFRNMPALTAFVKELVNESRTNES